MADDDWELPKKLQSRGRRQIEELLASSEEDDEPVLEGATSSSSDRPQDPTHNETGQEEEAQMLPKDSEGESIGISRARKKVILLGAGSILLSVALLARLTLASGAQASGAPPATLPENLVPPNKR